MRRRDASSVAARPSAFRGRAGDLASHSLNAYKEKSIKRRNPMIVTCPACSTRYLVDPQALGSAGRTVRCANCANTWHQNPPADAPLTLDAPTERPSGVELHGPGAEDAADAADTDLAAASRRRAAFRAQLPALAEKPPSRKRRITVLAIAALLVCAAAFIILGRDKVASLWPPAAELYAKAGLPVTPPGPAFEIRNTTPRLDKENGVAIVVVEGEIANVSHVARDVPRLRIILKDKDEKEVEQTTVSVPGPRLLPGASVPFRASVPQPSIPAAKVVVMIADEG